MKKHFSLLIILFLLSCAGLGEGLIQAPELKITDTALSGISIFKQDINLKMNIKNPNPFSLPIRGFSYKLDLNGVEFTSGFNETALNIPSVGETETTLRITGDLLSFIRKFNLGDAKQLNYSLSGDIAILSSSLRFPYRQTGELGLGKLF